MAKLLAILLVCIGLPAQAAVFAELDRNSIAHNETVQLTLTQDSVDGSRPDLSVLEADFQVFNVSASSKVEIYSNRRTQTQVWVINLLPRRQGKLTIPAIRVGGETSAPLVLTVNAASNSTNNAANNAANQAPPKSRDVFLDVEVEPKTVYVGQQINYTIKLYYRKRLAGGNLTDPQPQNAVVERLGDDREYRRKMGDQEYSVLERRYVIFPETSGNLVLPGITFVGEIAAGRGGAFNPFVRNPRVNATSLESTVRVLPIPPKQRAGTWLPSKGLLLTEKWAPEPPIFRVGQPLTRTLELHATGLLGTQLPDVAGDYPSGLQTYPEPAQHETRANAKDVVGLRNIAIAIVPTEAGEITLPAVELPWWDTENDRPRIARLPARKITVQPAFGRPEYIAPAATQPAPAEVEPPVATPTPQPTATTAAEQNILNSKYWAVLSLLLAVLWLLTLLLWWRSARRQRMPAVADNSAETAAPNIRVLRKNLQRACQKNDPAAAKNALLALGQTLAPAAPATNLGSLAALLNNAALATHIRQLDRQLYLASNTPWGGNALWQAARDESWQPAVAAAKKTALLPPLHPHRAA